MHKHPTKNWLFLIYLVLLINLGPSLHHADFFGLHCNDACCSPTSFSESKVSSCCCCTAAHSHGDHGSHSHGSSGESNEFQITAAVDDFGACCEDCVFCKFFDQFNVVAESFRFVLIQSPVCSLIENNQGTAFCEFVPESARGPPEFFSAELAV